MMKRKFTTLLALGVCASASAQTILIDFNDNIAAANTTLPGDVYNIADLLSATSFSGLSYADGSAATGISLDVTDNSGDGFAWVQGNSLSATDGFSAAAINDGYRDKTPGGANPNTVWTFTISGLDVSGATTYDIDHFAYSNLGSGRTADVTLTAGSTSGTSIYSGINTQNYGTITFSGVTPNPSGEIAYTFGNTSNNRAATVNALRITAVPEPSTYAVLVGLITLGVVVVRRRRQ